LRLGHLGLHLLRLLHQFVQIHKLTLTSILSLRERRIRSIITV
jgi:hypothetical protein